MAKCVRLEAMRQLTVKKSVSRGEAGLAFLTKSAKEAKTPIIKRKA